MAASDDAATAGAAAGGTPAGQAHAGRAQRPALDCHAHFMPPAFVSALEEWSADPTVAAGLGQLEQMRASGSYAGLFAGLGERAAGMESAGIGTQLLSMATPYIHPDDEGAAAAVARTWNDACHEAVSGHRGRFAVFASVPIRHVAAAVAETERVLGRSTTAGFNVNTHTAGFGLDDPSLAPLYELWDEREVTVFLHPNGFCVKGILDDYSMEWDLGTQFDDVIAVTRLIYAGVPERFPGIKWIVPHLGGALPFLLERLDQHWERDRGERALKVFPSAAVRALYFDTAGHGRDSIRFGLDKLGFERVVLGSDFPMIGAHDIGLAARTVAGACSTFEEADAVLRGNAERLLPREAIAAGG